MTIATKRFVPQIKDVSERDGTGTLVVATLNTIDHDRDVTLPGFFGRQTVSLVPAHNHTHVPLGKGRIYEIGNEALVDFQFNLKIGAARDWFEAIVFDFENPPALQQYSYGFVVYEGGARPGTHQGRKVQFLQPRSDGSPGALVYEVSPVMMGAGINTRTTSINGIPLHQGGKSNDEALLNEWARSMFIMNGFSCPSPEQEVLRIGRARGLVR